MAPAAQMIQIALFALVAGIAIPVLVQLFVTLRSIQRSATAVQHKMDETLATVTAVVGPLGASRPTGSDPLPALAAALVPALVAGFRAYRTTGAAAAPAQEMLATKE
jgi:hypothetical protein